MPTLIAIPLLSLLLVLQSAVINRLPLLQGVPDLILLVVTAWALQERVRSAWQWAIIGGLLVGYLSVLPLAIPLGSYLFATLLALAFRRRIWQVPILAVFAVIFVSSIANQLVTALYLSISGSLITWLDALNLIVLPSLILNLILVVPIYALIKDLAEWLHPEDLEI